MSTPLRPAIISLCFSCPLFATQIATQFLTKGRCFTCSARVAKNEPWPQRSSLGAYYTTILNDPTPYALKKTQKKSPPTLATAPSAPAVESKPAKKKPGRKPKLAPLESVESPNPSSGTSPPVPPPPPTSAAEKARIVFGSRLLGPAELADRLATKRAQSSYIAGVLVPPRPQEPDNCCMSGCVNCVWDRFREDMEEWTAKYNEAQRRLKEGHSDSLDSDGGKTDAPLSMHVVDAQLSKDMWDDDLLKSLPVGIREFMKQEKRLKEKHEREGGGPG